MYIRQVNCVIMRMKYLVLMTLLDENEIPCVNTITRHYSTLLEIFRVVDGLQLTGRITSRLSAVCTVSGKYTSRLTGDDYLFRKYLFVYFERTEEICLFKMSVQIIGSVENV